MKFLIVGGGSIGKKHLDNLLDLSQKATIVEPVKARADEIKRKYGICVYPKLEEALNGDGYDGALICNPNIFHIQTAIKIAKRGIHLFIEKPLSHDLEDVEALIRIVRRKRLYTFMGSNFKFHPSFKLMKKLLNNGEIGRVLSFTVISGQYLPDWHPWEDYRKGYSANKRLGGGVLLDSHEFDYIQWFLGPINRVACFTGKYSNLKIDTEDIAEAVVELEDKSVGNVHLDYIQRPYRRSYYFYGEKGTLEWSHRQKSVSLYEVSNRKWRYFKEDKNYNSNQMYLEEMKHFLNILRGREKSVTDIYDAEQALKVIVAAKRSSQLRRFIDIKRDKKW